MARMSPFTAILPCACCRTAGFELHVCSVTPRRCEQRLDDLADTEGLQIYEGRVVPQADAERRLARITCNSSLLSAGFWKNAVAPESRLRNSLPCGSRAVRTITGMCESVSLSCRRFKTMNPLPAGNPRSRMIKLGRSFWASAIAE